MEQFVSLQRIALAALAMLFGKIALAETSWTDWRQVRPFVVRADFPLADFEPLLAQLQDLQRDLVESLQISPAEEPIELFLFRTEASYRDYVLSRYPQAPQRRALFIKTAGGPGQVFAYQSSEFEIDLRHETTHALLHASLAHVPLWLDEGLAEYFEVEPRDRQRHNPHLRTLKWNLWMGLAPRLSSLEDKHELAEMGKREYMFAWAWVHFLLHGPPTARQELIEFLRGCQTGPPPDSLSQRLQRQLPNPEKRLARHFMHAGEN